MRKQQQVEDWDWDLFQYIHTTVLGRHDDFWSLTPRFFFSQLDAHKKYNSPNEDKDKKTKKSYVNGTEFM